MPDRRLSRDGREDASLAQRCSQGDIEAFSVLVFKYQDPVYNIVYRMVGDREQAMDLSQESFMKAFEGIDTYNPGMPFRSWMFRICTNTAIDNLRRGARKKDVPMDAAFSQDETPAAGGSTAGVMAEPPAPESDIPENVSLKNEISGMLQGALAELPENYRSVIVLHHLVGLSYREIGKILGVPRNTAKTWAHRGRNLLLELLEGAI